MKKIIGTLLIVSGLLMYAKQDYDNYIESEEIKKTYKPIQDFQSMKEILKNKYKWFSNKIYVAVGKEAGNYYEKGSEAYYKLIALVHAVIDAESQGKIKATGPKVGVYLNRGGKLKKEYHRARGLMQVMSFNFYGDNPKSLYNAEINIRNGIRILMDSMDKANGIIRDGLKNYNSGVNSKYYNEPYIQKVNLNFSETYTEWFDNQKNDYVVLID